MPVFTYKALGADGKSKAGVIDADSPKEARRKLRDMQLRPTEVAAVVNETPAEAGTIRLRLPQRTNLQELSLMTRQLGTLLSAGIPLMSALTALSEQTEDRKIRTTLLGVRETVAQGASFSAALSQHPRLFNDLYVNMVSAGEASGALDAVLFRLADYLSAQNRLRAKIVAALTYPLIIVILGIAVVTFLLSAVVPKITQIFERSEQALPMTTEILMAVSGFFASFWWLVLALLIGVVALWKAIVRTPGGKLWWDTLILRVPVLGSLLRKAAVSRFAVTFATLLESGLPVLESLTVVQRVVDNALVSKTLEEVRRKIAEGADIAGPLRASKVFPPVVTYMVAIGEEAGRLEELLRKIADAYDEEIEIAAQKLTAALEPILIVTMAVFVGFIVVAILQPIMEISRLR